MTPQEGYTEAIDDAPSVKQWKRIKARVAEIDGQVTTHTVFHDRYWTYPVYSPFVASIPVQYLPSAFTQLGVMDAQADLTE
jgi:hypothetical protein